MEVLGERMELQKNTLVILAFHFPFKDISSIAN